MNQTYTKPLPTDDPDSKPYWEAIRRGELRIQRCSRCGTYRWPARAMCNRCFSFDADWPVVSGQGVIKSWIKTWKAFLPQFKADIPYITVLVQLREQDDIQLVGQLTSSDIEPCQGMPVEAEFRKVTDTDALIFWKPRDTK